MIPRPEYPRPQMYRPDWLNLNGTWQFAFDQAMSGRERGMQQGGEYPLLITVPFCPESSLSGIGHTDFIRSVWYRRTFRVPEAWLNEGRVTFLRVDACDYRSEVWINGHLVGSHTGGYVGFGLSIGAALHAGDNEIVLCAQDDTRGGGQPIGKQCPEYASHDCSYTRTTGIWQTVWLENAPAAHIIDIRFAPDAVDGRLAIEIEAENAHGMKVSAQAFYKGRAVGAAEGVVVYRVARLSLPLSEIHRWDVGAPELYDIKLHLGEDAVDSYFGLRSIAYVGKRLLINGRPVYQRLVLDQGFYPDGIITAPNDEALSGDILRAQAMGFNGARLHMKVFEPRFLYHCDRLGYLVWGESGAGDSGLIWHPRAWEAILPEWLGALRRDRNHPSIIGWCPLNETGAKANEPLFEMLYHMTRALDPTRPFIDESGHVHHITDVFDAHEAGSDPEATRARYAPLDEGLPVEEGYCDFLGVKGLPVEMSFVSEFGGMRWAPDKDQGWGYGDEPKSEADFLDRYRGLTQALLNNRGLSAFCYIQLTDVEQEMNGLYTYDRRAKFDPALILAINQAPAAIEGRQSGEESRGEGA